MSIRSFSRSFSAIVSKAMATTSSPFTKVVVAAMRKLYPEKLADSRFDNTGLLLEAPYRPHLKNSVLLTIDLTKAVVEEAIARKDSIIITYHPIIFRPLKALTLGNSQHSSLLRLAQEGISVYSPHTAVDAVPGGLNDWLADIVTTYSSREPLVINLDTHKSAKRVPHGRNVIVPVPSVADPENTGYGRIVRFEKPQKLGYLLARIAEGLHCRDSSLSVATPQSVHPGSKSGIPISSIGICAGSGGSVFSDVDVDMLFTGELSHHEALAATEQGRVVVTTFHSNSERAFLPQVMQKALLDTVEEKICALSEEERHGMEIHDVAVSQVDRDPFEIIGSETDLRTW